MLLEWARPVEKHSENRLGNLALQNASRLVSPTRGARPGMTGANKEASTVKTKLQGTLLAGVLGAGLGLALGAMVHPTAVLAQGKALTLGIDLRLTGSDAEAPKHMREGMLMAGEEVNARGGVGGYKPEVMILAEATATAGGYDPAQAATNAKKFVASSSVVAALGPAMSGAGKAMAPILSAGNLAVITPSSANPDITR